MEATFIFLPLHYGYDRIFPDGAKANMKRVGIAVTVALVGMTAAETSAAAEDTVLNNSIGICETRLRQGNSDIGSLAETFGFRSTKMPDGSPAWQHEAGSNRTLIFSTSSFCAIRLNRGNYTSGATEVVQSWARASNTPLSATPSGDKLGAKGGFTYRYREFPQNGSGALLISRN